MRNRTKIATKVATAKPNAEVVRHAHTESTSQRIARLRKELGIDHKVAERQLRLTTLMKSINIPNLNYAY
jgi:hypothetical protein